MKQQKDIYENVGNCITELLILRLLCERDMYGYEIRNTLAERTMKAFDLKEATLYGPFTKCLPGG